MSSKNPGENNKSIFWNEDEKPEDPQGNLGFFSLLSNRLQSWFRNPVILPVVIIILLIVILSSITIFVQGRRMGTVESDFENLIVEHYSGLNENYNRLKIQRWAQDLALVEKRGRKISSGFAGLFLFSGRGVTKKIRNLRLGLQALIETEAGYDRHNALLSLDEKLDCSGIKFKNSRNLEGLIRQNMGIWEQKLMVEGGKLPADGRSSEWKEWAAQLVEFEKLDKYHANLIKHQLFGNLLTQLESKIEKSISIKDYGELFMKSYSASEILIQHKCPNVGNGITCRERWNQCCRTLFNSWALEVRKRSNRGLNVNEIAHQFDEWEEYASRLDGFSSAKLAVDMIIIRSESAQ